MRILVFQHLAVEHPGIFRDFWAEAGHSWDTVELDEGQAIPDFAAYDLLVVMGGPMDIWQEETYPWLAAEIAAIRGWVVDRGRPYLGICLGHQLLARALGGLVTLMPRPEVGLSHIRLTQAGLRDPILSGFHSSVETFQWHGAEISTLPAGAVVLAENEACATQAIRWGRHAYGLQYHVEITPRTVAEWSDIPAYKASLEQALGAAQAAALEAMVASRLPVFAEAASRLNQNLCRLLETTAQIASTQTTAPGSSQIPTLKLANLQDAAGFVETAKAAGFDFLRFEIADMAGMSRGKTIPVHHVAGYMRTGLNLYGGTVALDSFSIPVKNSGYNEEMNFQDCVMVLDPATLTPVPWLQKTGRVICDTMWYDGRPQLAAPRLLLKKLLLLADHFGFTVKMGHEYEFYVVDAQTRQPVFSGQPIFATMRTHQYAAIDELILVLQAQGIDIITYNTEHGPGQIEINFAALDGIAAADCAFVFKNTVKEFLAKRGLLATFMTKPYKGLSGSCSHYHISLLHKASGKNAFLDLADADGMSLLFRHFIQGVLEHMPAAMAIWNPTPNCYRRIRPHTYAPSNVSWGIQDRSASVRVKASRDQATHMEVRVPSALSNPYLVAASTIAAGLLGLREKNALLPPGQGPKEDDARYAKLPTEIFHALDALAADMPLRGMLGEEFIKVYLGMKWQETLRLRDEIPPAETNEYFELY